jgi:hypothetical protein
VIRNNWLVNPTGKPDGFRGADWLVKLNNLYTKVIYGGAGSNYTIKCIIEESILIDLYRKCHIIVQNGFYLTHRTIRHAAPEMGKTLQVLDESLQHVKPHIFEPGREANCEATDYIVESMATYLQQAFQLEFELVVPDGDEVETEIEANDQVLTYL